MARNPNRTQESGYHRLLPNYCYAALPVAEKSKGSPIMLKIES